MTPPRLWGAPTRASQEPHHPTVNPKFLPIRHIRQPPRLTLPLSPLRHPPLNYTTTQDASQANCCRALRPPRLTKGFFRLHLPHVDLVRERGGCPQHRSLWRELRDVYGVPRRFDSNYSIGCCDFSSQLMGRTSASAVCVHPIPHGFDNTANRIPYRQ